jgi:hypothetical protein
MQFCHNWLKGNILFPAASVYIRVNPCPPRLSLELRLLVPAHDGQGYTFRNATSVFIARLLLHLLSHAVHHVRIPEEQ